MLAEVTTVQGGLRNKIQRSQTSPPPSPQRLPGTAWLHVGETSCDFNPDIFDSISLNLVKNPNINSSLLFRADVLYDSLQEEVTDEYPLEEGLAEALQIYGVNIGDLPGFTVTRTLIRRMIPRNPQLDKPIAQSCVFLRSRVGDVLNTIVVYIPHVIDANEIPWYHPRVRSVAYLHAWKSSPLAQGARGVVSLHYRLFPTDLLPLSSRLLRTGQHLLTTIHKHGQGQLAGYTKRVNHDQLVSQHRVQDTYTGLKQRHATRLCDRWVEKTEPSKHVFEDLGIAAFLIELWKDMYRPDDLSSLDVNDRERNERPPFPGFVDIGCGNGVLIDILLREGYPGWGFDARRRKTWSTFDATIQSHLKEMILIPQPLFEMQQASDHANGSIISKRHSTAWHNGIFPTSTFIISNHADELTPWTPLLASISSSPFLAIPCCSHNLSGLRFRAPSVFNNNSADVLAPSYFSAHINKSKSIAIAVACSDNEIVFGPQTAESGDLNALNPKARAKQPSAYSSLCDWVAHLAARVGYKVEREMLRLPTTRNVGVIGRGWIPGFDAGADGLDVRRERVIEIAKREKVDGEVWVERAKGLTSGKEGAH